MPRPTTPEHDPADELAVLGLRPGERVRFRRSNSGRWTPAVVERRERDGSVGLRDPKGAAVAIRAESIEVLASGPRGGNRWEPLADRAARTEQLGLF